MSRKMKDYQCHTTDVHYNKFLAQGYQLWLNIKSPGNIWQLLMLGLHLRPLKLEFVCSLGLGFLFVCLFLNLRWFIYTTRIEKLSSLVQKDRMEWGPYQHRERNFCFDFIANLMQSFFFLLQVENPFSNYFNLKIC